MQNGITDNTSLITTGFLSFDERLVKERFKRLDLQNRGLSFGVSYLDDALGGIYPNDLVVLTAKTGLGKSQLGMLTALSNARAGKRVHFFALEAEEYEIERRVKYQMIADKFFSMQNRPDIRLNYLDWYYGNLDEALTEIEISIDRLGKIHPSLNVFYRSREFDVKEFERLFFAIKDETDLVIVDHLHYFDIEDENENRAMKEIVKKVRDCALLSGKPIILVAHVRKTDKRLRQLMPDIEDLHGSSDIGKIATKVITIAPHGEILPGNLRTTFMSVLKCRADGSRSRTVAAMAYNLITQRYEQEYSVGKLSFDGSEFEKFTGKDIPFWAVNVNRKDT